MAADNCFLGTGNLTKDPEGREVSIQGEKDFVVNATIAINGPKKDAEATFIDFEAWGPQARALVEQTAKGDKVGIQGELKQDRWEDKATGEKRSRLKIRANSLKFYAVKKWAKDGPAAATEDAATESRPSRPARTAPARARREPEPVDGDDEEIPF